MTEIPVRSAALIARSLEEYTEIVILYGRLEAEKYGGVQRDVDNDLLIKAIETVRGVE